MGAKSKSKTVDGSIALVASNLKSDIMFEAVIWIRGSHAHEQGCIDKYSTINVDSTVAFDIRQKIVCNLKCLGPYVRRGERHPCIVCKCHCNVRKRRALSGILVPACHDDLLKTLRSGCRDCRSPTLCHCHRSLYRGQRSKGNFSSYELPKDKAKAINVSIWGVLFMPDYFRAHVPKLREAEDQWVRSRAYYHALPIKHSFLSTCKLKESRRKVKSVRWINIEFPLCLCQLTSSFSR